MKRKVMEIIKKIARDNNFYIDKYNGREFDFIEEIPFLEKQELITDQKNYPPFGKLLNCKMKEIIRIHRTSGTSQAPLLIPITLEDEKVIKNVGSKAFKLLGVDNDEIVINCMNYSMWMGGMMDHLSIQESGAIVVPFGVGNTENLIELILSMNKVSIHATPSYMKIIKNVLSEKFNKAPKDLKLYRGYFGGESALQSNEFREKLEKEWGFQAYNANYGLSEVMSIIGSECKHKKGLHFLANGSLFPEIVDMKNQKVMIERNAVGELVLTNLNMEAQPLIRYKTGDVIKIIDTETCECGDRSFRFEVIGRTDDMIVVKGINFFPESIRNYVSDSESFTGNYRVIVPKGDLIEQFDVEVEYKDTINNDDVERLRKRIKSNLFVNPNIITTKKIEDSTGNKFKLLWRV